MLMRANKEWWLQAAARQAASAAAALAQDSAEQAGDPAVLSPDQSCKTSTQIKQPGGAKKARQRQRKQVTTSLHPAWWPAGHHMAAADFGAATCMKRAAICKSAADPGQRTSALLQLFTAILYNASRQSRVVHLYSLNQSTTVEVCEL